MQNQLVKIEADKIAEILDVPWELESFVDSFGEEHLDENYYVFNLKSTNGRLIKLALIKKPMAIVVILENGFQFRVDSISRVEYTKYNNAVTFETKDNNQFSQLLITKEGNISLDVGRPIDDYEKGSWCNSYKQEQIEIDGNKGKTYFQRYVEDKK